MNPNITRRAANYFKWWSYKREVAGRLGIWDRLGGGVNAAERIKPFELLARRSFDPVAPGDDIFQDPHYTAALRVRESSPWQEYVYHVRRPCYIEPEFGYAIMEPAILIPESLALSYLARLPHALHFFSGVPSVKSYEQARAGKQEVQEEAIVVSLRHVFDSNYFHCMIQLMTALMLLDGCGVPPEIPIVVSSAVGRMPFFQEMTTRGSLKNRRWIVQGAAFLHVQEVIFGMTEWPSQSLLDGFLDAVEAPAADPACRRRLFIVRRTRQLSTLEALTPILDEFGFEQVRTEELSFAQQMALFSQAEAICGATGAGLSNMIFRRHLPTKVLEIHASNEVETCFHFLAKTCGYAHSHLIGSGYETADRASNFSVEPHRLHDFFSAHISA